MQLVHVYLNFPGTTAEALKVLMAADGIQPVFDKALAAASRRSRELAG